MMIDLLLHGASLPCVDRIDQDSSLAFLPAHLPSPGTPTRHPRHDRNLYHVHHRIRHSNCAAMHTDTHCVGTLGRRASRKMYQPQRRCLGFCRGQHPSRFSCHCHTYERAQQACHDPSTQVWHHVHVPRWRLVSSLPISQSYLC